MATMGARGIRLAALAVVLAIGGGCSALLDTDSLKNGQVDTRRDTSPKIDAKIADRKVPAPDRKVDSTPLTPDVMVPDTSVTPDTAKPDTAKPDAAKPDAAKPDAAKPDAAKPDAAKPDAAKPDAAKPDAPAVQG
jgi:hypothetical protein